MNFNQLLGKQTFINQRIHLRKKQFQFHLQKNYRDKQSSKSSYSLCKAINSKFSCINDKSIAAYRPNGRNERKRKRDPKFKQFGRLVSEYINQSDDSPKVSMERIAFNLSYLCSKENSTGVKQVLKLSSSDFSKIPIEILLEAIRASLRLGNSRLANKIFRRLETENIDLPCTEITNLTAALIDSNNSNLALAGFIRLLQKHVWPPPELIESFVRKIDHETLNNSNQSKKLLIRIAHLISEFRIRERDEIGENAKIFVLNILYLLLQNGYLIEGSKLIQNSVSIGNTKHSVFCKDIVGQCVQICGLDFAVGVVKELITLKAYVKFLPKIVVKVLLNSIHGSSSKVEKIVSTWKDDGLLDEQNMLNFFAQFYAQNQMYSKLEEIILKMKKTNTVFFSETIFELDDHDECGLLLIDAIDILYWQIRGKRTTLRHENFHKIVNILCRKGRLKIAFKWLGFESVPVPKILSMYHSVLRLCFIKKDLRIAKKIGSSISVHFPAFKELLDGKSLVLLFHCSIVCQSFSDALLYLKKLKETGLPKYLLDTFPSHSEVTEIDLINLFQNRAPFEEPLTTTLEYNEFLYKKAKEGEYTNLIQWISKLGPRFEWKFDQQTMMEFLKCSAESGKTGLSLQCLRIIRCYILSKNTAENFPVEGQYVFPREAKIINFEIKNNTLLLIAYNLMLKSCLRSRNTQILQKIIRQMAIDNVPMDIYSYNTIIAAYANSGDFQNSRIFFLEMQKKSKFVPDKYTYSSMISALIKSAKGKEMSELKEMQAMAWGFLGAMRMRNIEIDEIIYNNLLQCFATLGFSETPNEIFNDMEFDQIKASTATFNTLISGLVRRRKFDQLAEVLTVMKERGIPRDAVTYLELMESCGQNSDVEGAQNWFHKMELEGNGLESEEYAPIEPTRKIYNTLIKIALNHDEDLIAIMIILRMQFENSSLTPDNFTYSNIISYYARKADESRNVDWWKGAEKWFEKMLIAKSKNSKLHSLKHVSEIPVEPFNSLMWSAPSIPEVWRYWRLMETHGVLPTSYSYSCLIRGLVSGLNDSITNENDFKDLVDIYRDLLYGRAKGVPIGDNTGFFLPSRNPHKEVPTSRLFLKTPKCQTYLGLDHASASLILDGCSIMGKIETLDKVWIELHEVGYPMQENTYNSFAEGLLRCGQLVRGVTCIIGDDILSLAQKMKISSKDFDLLQLEEFERSLKNSGLSPTRKTFFTLKYGLNHWENSPEQETARKLQSCVEIWFRTNFPKISQ
ncbi:hypothetical protein HK096_002315, partial [Nowakowskiella sp. JEL0078]